MGVRGTDAAPLVTICIVTGRRIPLLDACLASLQRQVEPPTFELLICSDGDEDVAHAVRVRFPEARIRTVTRAFPGAARNVLLDDAHGELLLFLDDDVTVRPDLLARLGELARTHPDVDVFGGPNDSPESSSRFQFVQGAAMASMVGAGPVRRRYGAHPAGPADERFFILCNLAIRRRAMLPFDPDLVCAEENALLSEMSRRGIAMHYDPGLAVFHERRETFRGFGRQMYKYGRGRGQLMVRTPATRSPAYLAPSALVAYGLLAPAAVALTRGRARTAALAPLAAYAAAVGAGAVAIAATLRKPTTLPLAAALIVELHVCYGAGVMRGLTERQRTRDAPEVSPWFDAMPRSEPIEVPRSASSRVLVEPA
jgi:succinoglycan biosynthesis protein ExoA